MKVKTKLKIVFVIVIIVLITVAFFYHSRQNIIPIVVEMSESTIQNYTVNAINAAAHMVIDETLNYEEMINIVRDNDGKITMIQANTVRINRLARDLANLAQSNIEMIMEQTISLPLGIITGSIVLAGYGPPIDIKLLPVGSVICNFVSVFESVGINQTRHSIYIDVATTISLVLPIFTVPVTNNTAVLVCESIIIGDVPEVYIAGAMSDDITNYLDLVPGR